MSSKKRSCGRDSWILSNRKKWKLLDLEEGNRQAVESVVKIGLALVLKVHRYGKTGFKALSCLESEQLVNFMNDSLVMALRSSH